MNSTKKTRISLRTMWLAAMIAVLLISVIGCSSNSNSTTSSEPSAAGKQTQPAAASGSSDSQPPQDAPANGGVLKVAALEDALNLGNPPTLLNQSNPNYAAPAVERLFRRNSQGGIEPFLAKGYQVADDHLSMTIELNPGIKFHDGSDFNAEVAKWNLDRYIATKRSETASIASVEVVDPLTLKLVLKQYDGLLLHYLSTIPGMMVSKQSAEAHDEKWVETNPVGTGPYRFVSWSRDQKIVYEKFDGYWQGAPKLDGIEIHVIADPMSAAAAFEKGDVDILMSVDPKNANDLKAKDKFDVMQSALASSVLGLLPDSAHPDSVFANLKVRQAVWHAIDFAAIAQTLGYGYYEPTFQLSAQGSEAYNPNVKGYPYDPDTAKKLLAEAGYDKGFSTTLYGQNTPEYGNILTAVQGYLSEVGITAKVELLDQGRYATMLTGGPEKGGWKDGLTIIPFTVVPNELGAYTRLMGPAVTDTRLPSLYNADALKNTIGMAAAESDPEKAKQLVQDIQKIATDDNATLFWIYALKGVSAKQRYVHDDNFNTPNWTPEKAWLDKK